MQEAYYKSLHQFGFTLAIGTNYIAVYDPKLGGDSEDDYKYYIGRVQLFDKTTKQFLGTIDNPNSTNSYENFGDALAFFTVSGNEFLAVGQNDSVTFLYIYDLSSGYTNTPTYTIPSPDPSDLADGGYARNLKSSGSLLFVNAGYATSAYDFDGTNTGRIYIYDFAGGTPTTPILTIDNPDWGDYISPDVADQYDGFATFYGNMAVDGNYLVVGAYLEDTYETSNGIAYVYDLSSGTPEVPVFILRPTVKVEGQQGSQFGHSVAISGNIVTVGASHQYYDRVYEENYQTGSWQPYGGIVYVYDISTGTPTTPVAIIENPYYIDGLLRTDSYEGTSYSYFGYTLYQAGNYLVAQAGSGTKQSARVYDLSTPSSPVDLYIIRDSVGDIVHDFSEVWRGVHIEGTSLFIGAKDHGTGQAGAVLELDVATGNYIGEVLQNPGPFGNLRYAMFGVSNFSRDTTYPLNSERGKNFTSNSSYVAVGALKVRPGTDDVMGIVRIYDVSTGNHLFDLTPPLDYDNLGYDGSLDPIAGGNTPTYYQYGFGRPVAINENNILAVGHEYSGLDDGIFFYDLGSGTPTQYIDYWNIRDNPVIGAQSGSVVEGLWFKGNYLFVSNYTKNFEEPYGGSGGFRSGFITIYDYSASNPLTQVHLIQNPNIYLTPDGDLFGTNLAYDNGILAVAAMQEDNAYSTSTGQNDGVIYLFDLNSATPTVPFDTIASLPVQDADYTLKYTQNQGFNLILSGNTLFVSGEGLWENLEYHQRVYVYDISGGSANLTSEILLKDYDWVMKDATPFQVGLGVIDFDSTTNKLAIGTVCRPGVPGHTFIFDMSNLNVPVLIGTYTESSSNPLGMHSVTSSQYETAGWGVIQQGHVTVVIDPRANYGLGSIKFFDTTGYTPVAYSGAYARIDLESYTGAYIRDAQEAYTGTYESSIPEQYTGLYERIRPSEYVAYEGIYGRSQEELFAETYTGEAFETYLGTYERTQAELYVGDYDRIESEDYLADIYTSEYESVYVSEYTAEYESSYQGSYNVDYTASYSTIYVGEYEGTYEGLGYTSEYTSIYETVYDAAYSGTYDSTYDATYTGEYGGTTYVSEYTSEYSGLQYTAGYDRAYESTVYLAENYEGDAYDGESYTAIYGRTITVEVPYGFKAQLTEPPLDYEIWTLYVRIA